MTKQVAQTFTAGMDGTLVGVALQIGRPSYSPAVGSLSVQIVNTIPGHASGGTGLFSWHYNHQAPYAGGRAFYRVGAKSGWTSPESDMAFQTFVEGVQSVPEPGALALLAGGLVAFGLVARRRSGV